MLALNRFWDKFHVAYPNIFFRFYINMEVTLCPCLQDIQGNVMWHNSAILAVLYVG